MRAVARRTRRTVGAGLFTLVVLGAGAACSAGGDSADPPRLRLTATVPQSGDGARGTNEDQPDLVEAMRRTVTARSLSVELRMEASSDQGSAVQVVTGTIDYDQQRGTSTLQGPYVLELRIEGPRTWVRADPAVLGSELPSGAVWIEGSTDEFEARGLISTDPDSTWAPLYLLAGAENVEAVGDGRYRFDLDLRRHRRRATDQETGGGGARRAAVLGSRRHRIGRRGGPPRRVGAGGGVRADRHGRLGR